MAKKIIVVDAVAAMDAVHAITNEGKVKVPDSPCPHCGIKFDGATSADLDGAQPSPGDLGICLGCGGWTRFDKDMVRQVPTEEEEKFIYADPGCIEAKRKVMEAIRLREEAWRNATVHTVQ